MLNKMINYVNVECTKCKSYFEKPTREFSGKGDCHKG